MTVVARRRPLTAPTPTATSRVRRSMRPAINVEAANAKRVAEAALESDLKLIAEAEDQIATASQIVADAQARIEKTLKANKMPGYTNGIHQAEFKDTWSRSSRVYDTAKFRALVSDDDFLSAVKVQAARAEELLSAKEIAKCSTEYPGEKTGTKLVIERIKIKVSKVKPR